MKKAAAKPTTTRAGSGQQPTLDGWVVAMQLVDTGLRVAVPILVLSYAGIRFDDRMHTTPLYTLIGFFLSLAVSTILVYQQIKKAYPDFFTSMRKNTKKDAKS